MKKADNELFFYRDAELAFIQKGTQTFNFFRVQAQPLAERVAGSAKDVCLLATDSSSSVLRSTAESHIEQHAYSAYGHTPLLSPTRPQLAFNGEYINRSTRSYLLGAGTRLFSPVLMRFHAPDSMSPFSLGGLNAYAYCLNDPVNFSDPTGHAGVRIFVQRYKSQASLNGKKIASAKWEYERAQKSLNRAKNLVKRASAQFTEADRKLESSQKALSRLERERDRIPKPDPDHWREPRRHKEQVSEISNLISEARARRNLDRNMLKDADARLHNAKVDKDIAMDARENAWRTLTELQRIKTKAHTDYPREKHPSAI